MKKVCGAFALLISFQLAASPVRAGIFEPSRDPTWKTGILFDEGTRELLHAESAGARETAALASDILVTSLIAYPIAVDALAKAGLRQSNWPLASQTLWISTEAYAVTGLANLLTKNLVGRERPYGRECAANGGYDPDCGGLDRYRSFYSGHSAWSFTAAGLICVNPGNAGPACPVALGAAATVALLRIIADKHYASDVLIGAAVGLGAGYLLPKTLHYSGENIAGSKTAPSAAASNRISVSPMAAPGIFAVNAMLVF